MKKHGLIFLTAIILLAGCSPAAQAENPRWVEQLVEQFQSEPVGNPPQSIWRYEYEGQTVYFVPAQCCDMYSTLYDADGEVICAPGGGIDGRGDGGCPDFFTERTGETLVWEDPRLR